MAACYGQALEPWFPVDADGVPADDGPASIDARSKCSGCVVVAECRNDAVQARNEHGIRGGMSPAERELGRVALVAGDALRYHEFLHLPVLLDPVEIEARLTAVEELPRRPCPRCGATIQAGPQRLDRNGPRATCGRKSTYDNGCRCDPCRDAKAAYHQRRKRS